VAVPKPGRGETLADQVDTVRQRIAQLHADLHQARSAPLPAESAKQIARAQIEALALRGRPSCLPTVELGRQVSFSTTRVKSPDVAGIAIPDAVALIAWLQRDSLIDAIERELDELADDAHAMTPADRQQRERELLDAILLVERQEESLVEAAEAEGLVIARRPDADLRAVFNLSSSLPPPGSIR
jgi:hypothetical protein